MSRTRAVGIGAIGVLIALPVLVALIVLALSLGGLTHLYGMPSVAMEPALDQGARVLAVKYVFGTPGRGDLVAFHTPPRAEGACGIAGVYIKRIVGMPGEAFQEQKGRVYIDGELLVETYVKKRSTSSHPRVKIPAGMYYVLGDNRAESCDSRAWGPLPRADIVGRVIVTYWPLSRIAAH